MFLIKIVLVVVRINVMLWSTWKIISKNLISQFNLLFQVLPFFYFFIKYSSISSILISFYLTSREGLRRGGIFWGGGRGRFEKKGATLRGLRISEKKEILRKPTVL